MDGLERLLNFTNMLKSKGVYFTLDQTIPDAIMISFTLVGRRVEVYFEKDGMYFSYFDGNEDVFRDTDMLTAMVDEYTRD